MGSSKKETKIDDLTILIVILVIAGVLVLGGIWYFSFRTITDPGVQKAASQALPFLLA